MSKLRNNLVKYLHYGPLFKLPRKLIKHLLSYVYPLVIAIWKLPKMHDIETTIIKIKKDKQSIARFGDSEVLYIVNKLNLPYQEYDTRLAKYLEDILKNCQPNLLVGLPDGFLDISNFENEIKTFWRSQISFTYPRFQKYLNLDSQYWNANITRLYYGYKDQSQSGYYFELMRSLWQDRDVLLIEGEKSRLGVGNDLFDTSKSLKRILGPAHHAFSQFDNLLTAAKRHPKATLILIAMGPTAKALSYVLTIEGYQCIDIGNLDLEYEWYKAGAKERFKVKGKYTSEVSGGRNVEDVIDEKYINQVVERYL